MRRPSPLWVAALLAAAVLAWVWLRPAAHPGADQQFPLTVGGRAVRVQLAVSEGELARGLKGRRDLGRDDGMLFVYRTPRAATFTMRGTPTPLDIAFFTPEGALDEVRAAAAEDGSYVTSRSARIQFALELNQGWHKDHGVGEGARLDLAGVSAALAARGFNPQEFGLAP